MQASQLVRQTEQLHEANASLRDLTARLLQIQDEERRRISRVARQPGADARGTGYVSVFGSCGIETLNAFGVSGLTRTPSRCSLDAVPPVIPTGK